MFRSAQLVPGRLPLGFLGARRRRRPAWSPGYACSRGRDRSAAVRCAGPWRSCAGPAASPRRCRRCCSSASLFLWEELFGQDLWFGTPWQPGFTPLMLVAVLIVAAGVAAVVWLPRAAAVLAVAGTVLIGLVGVVSGVQWLWDPGIRAGRAVERLHGRLLRRGAARRRDHRVFAGLEGVALVAVGCLLAPRLLTWSADFELAERAQALARRVDGLTRTRSDATETAVAELRRIERDLHDGAQARLVAVGMSLRAAEELMRPTRRRRWRWSRRRGRRPREPSPTCATWCAASTRRCWPTAAWPRRCATWPLTPCSTWRWRWTWPGSRRCRSRRRCTSRWRRR